VAPSSRATDLALIALLLPLLLPLVALVALVVFLDSPGRILYRAQRLGVGGRPFGMLKFRSMRSGAAGAGLTGHADERITPIGRFLRSSRLDELPQLWNVIRGEMRLVGPRPEAEQFVARYRDQYQRILRVPPGLTGSTQLEFAMSEAGMLHDQPDPVRYYTEEIMPAKVRLDVDYAETRSLGGDLKILAHTVALPFEAFGARVAAWARSGRAAVLVGTGTGLALTVAIGLLIAGGSPE
jgi:lipopolysaccharide/colanic/teichoic acid biosynthesis glycosyltransferase